MPSANRGAARKSSPDQSWFCKLREQSELFRSPQLTHRDVAQPYRGFRSAIAQVELDLRVQVAVWIGHAPSETPGFRADLQDADVDHPVRGASALDACKRRPTVICVYYPHWHNYDHGSAWKGEGWTEWEGVKAAVPRFPGHHQPLKPARESRVWSSCDSSGGPGADGSSVPTAPRHGAATAKR